MDKSPAAKPTSVGTWNDPTTRNRVLCGGFFGGVASALIKPLRDVEHWLQLFDGSHNAALITAVGLGLLGVFLVWLFQEVNTTKAITITVGLSSLIANMGASAFGDGKSGSSSNGKQTLPQVESIESSKPAPASTPAVGLVDLFAPRAWAQSPPGIPGQVTARSLTLELNSDQSIKVSVDALDSAGSLLKTIEVSAVQSKFKAASLPSETNAVRLKSGNVSSSAFTIQASSGPATLELNLEVVEQKKIGFLQVLGKAPEITPVLKVTSRTRPQVPIGEEGWVYVGKRQSGTWQTNYLKLGTPGLPVIGQEYATNFTLNFRTEPGSGSSRKGIISTGQKLRAQEVKEIDGTVWARVTVTSSAVLPP